MPEKSNPAANSKVLWYIMFHPKPDIINKYLIREKAKRARVHQPDFVYVIPYLFLNRAESKDEIKEGTPTRARGWLKKKVEAEKQLKAEEINNSLRNYLHYFVFIKSTKNNIDVILRQYWNTEGLYRLTYRYTHGGEPLCVSDAQMQPLLRTLALYQHKFSFTEFTAEALSAGTVEIMTGPLAGHSASVLKVKGEGQHRTLTLGVPVFKKEFMLKLKDFPASDVRVLGGSISSILQPYFLDEFEHDLIRVLRMRVRKQESTVSRKENQTMLSSYGSVAALSFEDESRQKHFCGLQLLHAVLLREAALKTACLDKVVQLLAGAEAPSSDEDAFLMAMLFVATRKGNYRKAVKNYVQTHTAELPSLHALLPVIKDINTR